MGQTLYGPAMTVTFFSLNARLHFAGYEAWIPLLFKVLPCWANSSKETPVLSPLVPVSLLGSSKGEDQKLKVVTMQEKVQVVLMAIKQSREIVNLVAALVRGMLVKDALMQLELTIKLAAKTVYQDQVFNEVI
ncbi:hypothetical protein JHK82_026477 [Glycine max]|nr:hypothetical protein JHK82_026477 [Glycine max]